MSKDLGHERAIAGAAPDSVNVPPCERPFPFGGTRQHPRFPSGDCVVCGALCTEGCKHEDYEAWEKDQTS